MWLMSKLLWKGLERTKRVSERLLTVSTNKSSFFSPQPRGIVSDSAEEVPAKFCTLWALLRGLVQELVHGASLWALWCLLWHLTASLRAIFNYTNGKINCRKKCQNSETDLLDKKPQIHFFWCASVVKFQRCCVIWRVAKHSELSITYTDLLEAIKLFSFYY